MKPSRDSTRKSGKNAAVKPQLTIVASNVISLSAVRAERIERAKVCPDVLLACRELLAQAEAGQIQSFAFVVQYSKVRHEAGIAGGYVSDSILLMGATQKLSRLAGVVDEASST